MIVQGHSGASHSAARARGDTVQAQLAVGDRECRCSYGDEGTSTVSRIVNAELECIIGRSQVKRASERDAGSTIDIPHRGTIGRDWELNRRSTIQYN